MNQKLIHEFTHHSDKVSEKSVKWMNHILNAQQIWNNRISRQEESYAIWQMHSLGALKDIDTSNFARTMDILETEDFLRVVEYTSSVGKAYSNSVKDSFSCDQSLHLSQRTNRLRLSGKWRKSFGYGLYCF